NGLCRCTLDPRQSRSDSTRRNRPEVFFASHAATAETATSRRGFFSSPIANCELGIATLKIGDAAGRRWVGEMGQPFPRHSITAGLIAAVNVHPRCRRVRNG